MSQSDPRKAYNALAKYFGMRARDAFLDPLKQSSEPKSSSESTTNSDPMGAAVEAIFSQGLKYKSNAQLDEIMKQLDEKVANKTFCVTTSDGSKFGKVQNKAADPGDQGNGVAKGGNYKLKDIMNIPAGSDANGETIAIQVFPIATGLDVTDTEIASLYLNSLYTQAISQAVPYLDVRVIGTPILADTGNFSYMPPMSLGKFLSNGGSDTAGEGTPDAMLASFVSDFTSEKREGKAPLSIVAGMEVFTTPQTLVDASDVDYTRETGGRVDAFRPFMGIESLEVADVFDGGGTISYKSASMKIKLFDKGRLSEVAEFVAPRRDPNVKFEITYGWSHPDGTNFSRPSDADAVTRIGRMIDAMRVTEVYTLVNSSYSIQADGTVDIDLTLTMDGRSALATTSIDSLSLRGTDTVAGVTVIKLAEKLEDIKNALLEANSGGSTRIDLPLFVQSPDVDSIVTMDAEALKSIQAFASKLKNSKDRDVKKAGVELWTIFNKKGSTRGKLRSSRDASATKFIKKLTSTPDPFIRGGKGVTDGEIRAGGVKVDKAIKGRAAQKYVSYGKIVSLVLGEALAGKGDLQLVFSSFNHNAAGVYDYNIAQFPIQVADLTTVLKAEMKKRTSFTVDSFIKFLSDKFLTFDGAEAFGRSDLVKPNSRKEGHAVAKNKTIQTLVDSKDPADQLKLQRIERDNLNRLYGGGRSNPTFTKPRVNMRMVTKKADDDASKTVTRIYFQDQAAGRLVSSAEAIMQLIREGSIEADDYKGVGKKYRGPEHNVVYQKNFGGLEKEEIVGPIPDEVKQAIMEEVKKVKKKLPKGEPEKIEAKINSFKVLRKQPGNLRKFFFENSPYLLHGTEASGIIEAGLNSEADENLTNIFLASRYSAKKDAKAPTPASNLPFRVHPASLSLVTYGCPFLNLTQKYFIDFGTNTTLDNYYVCTSVTHTIGLGDYKTSVEMRPQDAFGSFANISKMADDIFIKSFLAANKIPPPKKRRRRKKGAKGKKGKK